MTTQNVNLKRASLAVAMIAATFAGGAAGAAPVSAVDQAVNIFQSGSVTNGAPLTVDVGGPTTIGDEIEFPSFAFGTYDVDVSANALTMTFVNDPANLGIAEYDASTVDLYYFAFDRRISSTSLGATTSGFVATVEVIAPGATASSVGSFVPGLATAFSFPNGGVLISIGEGTNLNTVGTGGSLTVDLTAVPLPAGLPLLLAGVLGLGLIARRRSTA